MRKLNKHDFINKFLILDYRGSNVKEGFLNVLDNGSNNF